jgi:glyoxylase-like metal-dependent hydrolase (beta-lactamase superfamily II)
MGGLANRQNGYWELTFPDAKIRVSEKGWKKAYSEAENFEETDREFFYFLDSKADLVFLKDQDTPFKHVRTENIGGHTEFHQVLFYENGQHRYLMAGDVIGRRMAINRNFAAKYDFDPKKSMAVRNELKELAYREGYTILAYHETDYPLFRLSDSDDKKSYTIENVS